ncbi:hypothetical protein [Trinickia dinghuensis]|uniref:hypothetical protein n=1 Tax=Trinickia dinghuensis TaxID=2291023 RepID=UPI0011C038EC|nr:hypothetical protein [Trinickia dinghuensis]
MMKKLITKFLAIAAIGFFGASSVAMAADPVPMGSFNFNSSNFASNTLIQIVAPSTNVHGVYLRTCAVTVFGSTAGANTIVISAPSAPTPFQSGNIILFSVLSPPWSFNDLKYPILVPAGNGVWAYTSLNGSVFCNYDVLN